MVEMVQTPIINKDLFPLKEQLIYWNKNIPLQKIAQIVDAAAWMNNNITKFKMWEFKRFGFF